MKNKYIHENFIDTCAALLNTTFEESREEFRTRIYLMQAQKIK